MVTNWLSIRLNCDTNASKLKNLRNELGENNITRQINPHKIYYRMI
jgi:hypothetical protein